MITADYRLRDLVELSHPLLGGGGEFRGESKRVQWNPSERLFRYYTTLGLLDRPAEMRGRTAWYGIRHLLQILAIKRLQSSGASLREVQEALAGQPDRELRKIAGLPEDWMPPARTEDEVGPAEAGLSQPLVEAPAAEPVPFWARVPVAPIAGARDPLLGPGSPGGSPRSALPAASALPPDTELVLGPGVTLTLSGELASRTTLHGLLKASRPLLEYLASLEDHPPGGGEDDR